MHATVKAVALLTLASVTASGQGLGDLLRVHAPQGVIEGQVVRMDAGSLVLDQGRRKVTVARAEVDSMFRRTNSVKGATAAFGIAGALFMGFVAVSYADGMCDGGAAAGCSGNPVSAFGGGAVAGGLLGALSGAVLGSKMVKWLPVRR